MIAFIDAHRDRRSAGMPWVIEPICRVLQIAPSAYYAAKARPPSARAERDATLRPEILRVHEQNLAVYGADKIRDQLNKEDIVVTRRTGERLMREIDIQGCRRCRTWVRTTECDKTNERPTDRVDRDFHAVAPNVLWVADLTSVKAHAGWGYAAFIIDVFSRMIVGWQASRSLSTDLAIDELEMAVHNRGRTDDLSGLIHHGDPGSPFDRSEAGQFSMGGSLGHDRGWAGALWSSVGWAARLEAGGWQPHRGSARGRVRR